MDKFDENYISVSEYGDEKFVIILYSDNTYGVMIKNKFKIELIGKRFISSDLARDCVKDIVDSRIKKDEMKNESVEQLSLF